MGTGDIDYATAARHPATAAGTGRLKRVELEEGALQPSGGTYVASPSVIDQVQIQKIQKEG